MKKSEIKKYIDGLIKFLISSGAVNYSQRDRDRILAEIQFMYKKIK